MSYKCFDIVNAVKETGIGIIPGAFQAEIIEEMRCTILNHINLMKNTRQALSSRHLAGFHRFPSLEQLHNLITGHSLIHDVLTKLCGEGMRTIGLSDITINRSQQWHKDLLRGKYKHYLNGESVCEESHGKVFKVLVYLQDSSSLQYVEGSHRQDIPLNSDKFAIPHNDNDIHRASVSMGDAVVLDICTTHRGSTEADCALPELEQNPRILISTVYGRANCTFTDRMEIGNTIRLIDWAKM